MLSPQHITELSSNLQQIKRTSHFGWTSIVYFGDHYQLPPVNESSLWTNSKNLSRGCQIQGKTLFTNSVQHVVELKTCHRQSVDSEFQSILLALRLGNIHDAMYNRLLTRVAGSEDVPSLQSFSKALFLFGMNLHVNHFN
jgi:hypothetical protein